MKREAAKTVVKMLNVTEGHDVNVPLDPPPPHHQRELPCGAMNSQRPAAGEQTRDLRRPARARFQCIGALAYHWCE